MRIFDRVARRALFSFDPETAHGLSIAALKTGAPVARCPRPDPKLAVTVAGIDFPNPLGMAAGYDKNAEVPDALLRLGFGFAEVGTVTPLAQPGNPKPRIFRLTGQSAVVNRLGFNNEGHAAAAGRLSSRGARGGIVGANIGANKDSADRVGDYVLGVTLFSPLADYLAVNISSPNTPGLRNLQTRESLRELLGRVAEARRAASRHVPIFLKIAPDLVEADLEDIAAEVLANGIDGIIVSNTTLSRAGVEGDPASKESGGLSGRPVFDRSTIVLAKMRRLVGKDLALIGVGGVDSSETALEKIAAGADLVQLYTGMIYGGPQLPGNILRSMGETLDHEGIDHISALRDTKTGDWAARPIPAP